MSAVDGKTVRSCWLATTVLTSLAALIPSLAVAQVITDGSTGPGGALSGSDYQITDDLGIRAGDNLFQSFSEFSIGTGQSATFSGPGEIEVLRNRAEINSSGDGGGAVNIRGALFRMTSGLRLLPITEQHQTVRTTLISPLMN